MTFGKNLKAARNAAHISRSEFAKHIKRSVHTVKSWELDRHKPDELTIAKIEQFFHLERGYFSNPTSLSHAKLIGSLTCAIQKLPNQKRQHAIALIENITHLIS
ncbi:helix-turn-helix domain-containing protein [Marinomonas spartinae]|uniref:helix-turn-helix domain-containing protein n=1 Tax=Marinomonas spartinae TaxID=1792290 RepID=UPI0018F278D9|nr:helix-turn-helix transcriptional regulator [Marinomonas spartinae]MBJ7555421.1 helix-turn-helix transcriptional regulator [Marinomonas spartinae]